LAQPCFYLFRSIIINPEGAVSPCCGLFDEQHDFGNLMSDGLGGLWNNERYRSARASFARRTDVDLPPTVCTTCQVFQHPVTASRKGIGSL